MTHRDLAILLIWLFGKDEPPHKAWVITAARRLRVEHQHITLMTTKKAPVTDEMARDVELLVAVHLTLAGWQTKRAGFKAWCDTEGLSAAGKTSLDAMIAKLARP